MDAFVVDNEKTAKDCIQYIKEQVLIVEQNSLLQLTSYTYVAANFQSL